MYRLAGFFFVFVAILSVMAPIGTAHAAKETVLYSFCAQAHCADGAYPNGSLTVVNGVLYGTTQSGGANYRCYVSDFGCGTIFSLNPQSDVETVLHSFDFTDGAFPLSGLVNLNGTLYGTTAGGGNYEDECFEGGCGTVYSLNLANNAETVLYAFCNQQNCADGSIPDYGIANVGNAIYGTTQWGGSGCNYQDYSFGCGTVFSIDLETGAENVLYSFVCQEKESCVNGTDPETISSVGESLYGTTFQGGSGAYCLYRIPCGTVFSIDLDTGAETTLYSFCSQKKCTDGADPAPAVINVNGILYGSTIGGGTHRRGVVFSLNPTTGIETVLYSFCERKNCKDGAGPYGLVYLNGMLYGTTGGGGTRTGVNGCIFDGGCGIVFSLDPTTGVEAVLHTFCSRKKCADGADPGGLVALNGILYGTAYAGGTERGSKNCSLANGGCGTVFAITP